MVQEKMHLILEKEESHFCYIDGFVRAVECDNGQKLQSADKLHHNLQFTIEIPNLCGKLGFLIYKN